MNPIACVARSSVALTCLLLGACVSPWPSAGNGATYWHVPQALSSPDEALGTIRNLQGRFVSYEGGEVVAVEADDMGLRLRTEKEVVYSQSRPSYGGFFAGSTYVPTYSSVRTTSAYTDRDWTVVPLRDVHFVYFRFFPARNWRNRWLVVIETQNPERGSEMSRAAVLRAQDAATAASLVDAIYTLAVAAGSPVGTPRIGLGLAEMSDDQWQALGLPGAKHGVFVTDVYKGGPAERAGFQFLDVILAMNGCRIDGTAQFLEQLKSIPTDAVIRFDVLRHRDTDPPREMHFESRQ